MKDQNVTACIKQHKPNEFYVKRVRGGYFAVIDNYRQVYGLTRSE